MISVPDICRAMVPVLERIDGLTVAFPKPDRIRQSPTAVILWGSANQATTIDHTSGFEAWSASISVQVLVDHRDATPREVERIYDLITPINDLFSVGVYHDGPAPLDGLCDRCLMVDCNPEWLVPYGNQWCYGANLTFEVQFTRVPGESS
ncbi:MAG: hypothetical protein ACTHMX_09865 [Thermomicrobiales bacterium]